MKLLLILLLLSAAVLLVSAKEGSLLHRLFGGTTSTTTTTTTQAPAPKQSLYINNNLPVVPTGCTAYYGCSKKLTTVPNPRPCVKYCLKRIECPNNQKTRGKPNECVQLNEALVLQEIEKATTVPTPTGGGSTTEKIMEVAMIDFPCQPGYLPDSHGRCREIW